MDAAMVDEVGAADAGAVRARLVARREGGRELAAGAQHLDGPGDRRDRAAAGRSGFHGLHENRLGDIAVLSDAAGAGRDPALADAKDRAVSYRRDLARPYARHPGGIAVHRRARNVRERERGLDLWPALP